MLRDTIASLLADSSDEGEVKAAAMRLPLALAIIIGMAQALASAA
jgi:hypothetical protein